MANREEGERLARRLMAEWGFAPSEELVGGWCSVVYADESLVLKAPFQGEEQVAGHVAARRLGVSGLGPVVHKADEPSGGLLLDRVVPGTPLSTLGMDDDQAIPIFLSLAKPMASIAADGLMPLADYYSRKTPLIESLLDSSPAPVFLHGDLHHENILFGEGRWWAIDAKGLQGDPAFEAVAFLRNPIEALREVTSLKPLLSDRIKRLADGLGVSAWRVWAWSLVDRLDCDESEPGHPWARMRQALEDLDGHFS